MQAARSSAPPGTRSQGRRPPTFHQPQTGGQRSAIPVGEDVNPWLSRKPHVLNLNLACFGQVRDLDEVMLRWRLLGPCAMDEDTHAAAPLLATTEAISYPQNDDGRVHVDTTPDAREVGPRWGR